ARPLLRLRPVGLALRALLCKEGNAPAPESMAKIMLDASYNLKRMPACNWREPNRLPLVVWYCPKLVTGAMQVFACVAGQPDDPGDTYLYAFWLTCWTSVLLNTLNASARSSML